METATYDQMYNQAIAHFQAGEYGAALDLLTEQGGRFPDERTSIDYLRSCAAVRVGQTALALEILQRFLSDGVWFSEQVLRTSPSYAPLQGTAAFELLVKGHGQLRGETAGESDLLITPPVEGTATPYPLLLALHGNGSSPDNEREDWGTAAEEGWLVAAPQSAQMLWAGADSSVWTDHETAAREIQAHYDQVSRENPLDPTRLVLAGFSMGGEIALWLALRGEFTARGFVLVGPGGGDIDNPEAWRPLIESAAPRNLRGVIFLGEADNAIPHDHIQTISDLLNEGGIPCRLVRMPDIRHEFPADFGERLAEALRWVEGVDEHD
jgi:dienelactone hydrolase